jgi:putative addiction module killer protein
MTAHKKELILYETADGAVPFEDWLLNLRDCKARAVIRARPDRLETGNAGKCESLGEGIFELKIYFGPGYRVYFGNDGLVLIILLCGGDKSSQRADIDKARKYWTDYRRRL